MLYQLKRLYGQRKKSYVPCLMSSQLSYISSRTGAKVISHIPPPPHTHMASSVLLFINNPTSGTGSYCYQQDIFRFASLLSRKRNFCRTASTPKPSLIKNARTNSGTSPPNTKMALPFFFLQASWIRIQEVKKLKYNRFL